MKYLLVFLFFLPFLSFAQYAEYDWEERDTWMPIQRIFKLVNIKEGNKVADIGCHEGYLSIHLANKVGAEGEVFAVDVNSYRLDRLKEHLSERELFQITTVKGDYDNPNLPEGALDIVFIIDTYHEISAHKTMLKYVYNSLKPGGKLVLLEKLKERVKNASRKSQTDAHTLSSNYVKKEMEAANFSIIEEAYDLGDWEKDETKPMWLVIGRKEVKSKNRKL